MAGWLGGTIPEGGRGQIDSRISRASEGNVTSASEDSPGCAREGFLADPGGGGRARKRRELLLRMI